MSCKKAVICSKTSSFEEVLGKDSILINKNDISIIKDVILETVNNEEYRNDIENKGKIQSQKYKWDTSNKKLVNVYESIA
jgi:glycosyltransferase involved in cell wall biosynthesis